MSFIGQVLVGSEWVGNGLRFASAEQANSYASDLAMRWTSCSDFRAVESVDPVTHVWSAGRAIVDIATGYSHVPPIRVRL